MSAPSRWNDDLPPYPPAPAHRVQVGDNRPQVPGPDPPLDDPSLDRALVVEVDQERGPVAADLTLLKIKALIRDPGRVSGVDPHVSGALG